MIPRFILMVQKGTTFRMEWKDLIAAAVKKGSGVSVGLDEDSSDEDYPEPSETQFLVQRNEEGREWSLLEQHKLERMVPQPVEVQEMGIAGRTRGRSRPTRQLATSGISPGPRGDGAWDGLFPARRRDHRGDAYRQ